MSSNIYITKTVYYFKDRLLLVSKKRTPVSKKRLLVLNKCPVLPLRRGVPVSLLNRCHVLELTSIWLKQTAAFVKQVGAWELTSIWLKKWKKWAPIDTGGRLFTIHEIYNEIILYKSAMVRTKCQKINTASCAKSKFCLNMLQISKRIMKLLHQKSCLSW